MKKALTGKVKQVKSRLDALRADCDSVQLKAAMTAVRATQKLKVRVCAATRAPIESVRSAVPPAAPDFLACIVPGRGL